MGVCVVTRALTQVLSEWSLDVPINIRMLRWRGEGGNLMTVFQTGNTKNKEIISVDFNY